MMFGYSQSDGGGRLFGHSRPDEGLLIIRSDDTPPDFEMNSTADIHLDLDLVSLLIHLDLDLVFPFIHSASYTAPLALASFAMDSCFCFCFCDSRKLAHLLHAVARCIWNPS